MSRKRKLELFFDEYGVYIFLGLVAIIAVCVVIIAIPEKAVTEGMIMTKFVSPIHEKCGDLVCPRRWIIVVQSGDRKDWWQVSESYFQNVDIGDWVKK